MLFVYVVESRQIKEEYNVGASGIGPPKKVRNCATPMGMRDSNDLPRDSDSKDSMGGHEIDDDDYADVSHEYSWKSRCRL